MPTVLKANLVRIKLPFIGKTYFCKLLNTNTINEDLKSSILDKFEGIQYTDGMSVSTVKDSDRFS